MKQNLANLAVCLASVLVALLVVLAFYPRYLPLAGPLFLAAVVLSAWHGGVNTGMLATVATAVMVAFLVLPQRISAGDHVAAVVAILCYFGVGFSIALMSEWLKRGEIHYRRVLELSPDAVLIVRHGRLLYVNQAAARLLGATCGQEMVGRAVADFLDRNSLPQLEKQVSEALRHESTVPGIQQIWNRSDGESVEVEALAASIPWRRGAAVQIVLHDLKARLAAVRAQAQLASIVQSSQDAIIGKDLSGKIVSWNAAAERLYGYTAQEAIGQNDSMLAPPDWIDEMPSVLAAVERNEAITPFETRRRHKSGRIIDVALSVSPIRDARGEIVGAAKIARDISERKQIERERSEFLAREQAARQLAEDSEQRYRALADALPQFVWVARPDGLIEYCNTYWTQYTGLTAEQTTRNSWQAVVHPADHARTSQWQTAIVGGQPFELECRLRRAVDGAYRWFLVRVVPVRNAQGQIVRWIGTGADIHERRCAAEALRKSEARLRRLTESNIIGVVFADDQGGISYANEAFLRTTGFSRGDLESGKLLWSSMTPPEWHPLDEKGLAQCRQHGACTPYEKEFFRKDGGRVPVLIGYALFEDPATEYIGFVLDLSDQKRLEQELRRQAEQLRDADRRKDEFLAMLGHELRNPLAAILTGAQVLRLSPAGTAMASETQQIIERQAGHMGRLIDDLLDVARITRGKILLRQQALDIVALVRRTVDDQRVGLTAQQLNLAVDLPDEPVWVFGDPTRLAQVIGNILHNAQKFTPAGGWIEVRLSRVDDGRRVEISIRDTGIGIPSDMLERIFEPFSQAERNVGARQGGLGLGLALVHGLVQLHGGQVHAKSDGPNRGTTIVIRLPVHQEVGSPFGERAAPTQATSRRILVIEDNRDTAKSLEILLKCAGHEVAVAPDGDQGLQTLAHLHPDVVLCDIGLPGGMDGYAVARAIRQQPNHIPYLIALTGFGQEEDHHRALEAGFDLHLVKPVDAQALERALCNLAS